jgi:hypothetical protein
LVCREELDQPISKHMFKLEISLDLDLSGSRLATVCDKLIAEMRQVQKRVWFHAFTWD